MVRDNDSNDEYNQPVWSVKSRQMSAKNCPKMISLEKLKISTSLQKLPKIMSDLGKIIAATGFKNLPKVQ